MRIHFNFSVVLPLFARVAHQLMNRHGVEGVSGFVYGRDSLIELRKLGFSTARVAALTDALRDHGDRDPDMAYLQDRERVYGDPTFNMMLSAIRSDAVLPWRRQLQILEVGLRTIERSFDADRPDAVISDGVACTMSYLQYAIAGARGIPFLTVAPARINGRFYVVRNHRDKNERVDALYEGYKRDGLPDRLRILAEAFVTTFRERAIKPDAFVQLATVPGVDLDSFHLLVDVTRRYYGRFDPENYLTTAPHRFLWNRLVRIAKTRVLEPRHFEAPVDGEPFIFFPLHFQPELTTLILAPFYVNQIAAIENVAKTLPIDQVLYVKEHKASLGRRPSGYYQAIRKIPNVRLLSPFLDSHDLIKRCSAVCVLSSTVGWEAVLYEKPVVSLGDVFYNSFDLVTQARSYEELAPALATACSHFVADRELLLKYVAANVEGTYAGDVFHPPGSPTSPSLAPANVARVAEVLAAELELPTTPTPLVPFNAVASNAQKVPLPVSAVRL